VHPVRARGRGARSLRESADVARALAELVGKFLDLAPEARTLAAAAWKVAHARFAEGDTETAERLARVLRLVDAPAAGARPRRAVRDAARRPRNSCVGTRNAEISYASR
jgi:hypothetical protein